MAPEQVRGSGRVDTRADLYALGVMLFQMLTGRLPFARESAMETALARLYEPPRDPLTLRPNLPQPLADLLLRSLECNPDARFQTAEALAVALRAARPAGPDLAEYLRARAVTARRGMTPAGRWSLNQEMADQHSAAPTLAATAAVRSTSRPPLPLLNSACASRQLAVTVLLFKFAGDKELEYLAHGLTEEIIDRLGEAEALLLTSFGVVRGLSPELRAPSEVGAKLHSQVIVDGTLRLVPGGLAATIRLVEVERGLQLAVRRFERPDRNALALALEVAQVLGDLLTVQVDPSQGAMVDDVVAVDLYMQARHRFHCMSASAVAQCVELFEQALARLPDDPTLLAGYAAALARHWFFGGEKAAERATWAAERATHVAPERGESFLALATVQLNGNQVVAAASSLRTALARAPRAADAHELCGHLLTETGPMELALRHLNYAMMLDRAVPRIRFSIARTYALDGQPAAALAALFWEGYDEGFSYIRWLAMARVMSWFRDAERARACLADPALAAPELQQPRRLLEFIAGQRQITIQEYLPATAQSKSASPRARLFGVQMLIEYHCIRNQFAEALQLLRESSHSAMVDIQWLDRCPLLAPLREAADFAAIRAPVAELAKQVQRALGVSAD